jgi:predicted metal-binding membrane protein
MSLGDMSLMGMGKSGAMTMEWTLTTFGLMFLMWWIMMIGMMVPSAAPMILLYSTISRKQLEKNHADQAITIFVASYLLIWFFFSLLATLAQWLLTEASLVSPMLMESKPSLTLGLLIACGIYQLSPLKQTCLSNCRSPLSFFMARWQPGRLGSLKMGLSHGAYCVGCCWLLMALLFVGGVMNLLWVALIAMFVLVEKVLPQGDLISKLGGVVMLILAGYQLVSGVIVSRVM